MSNPLLQSTRAQRPVVVLRDLVRVREQGGVAFELRVPAFDLHPGEFVALVGESGCGKSTLLDILALVLRPSSVGSFVLRDGGSQRSVDADALWQANDEDGLARVRREMLGYVLQSGGLLPFLISSITMTAVGDAAYEMIHEIRRQFREIPGLREGKKDAKPDYERCVDISTKA